MTRISTGIQDFDDFIAERGKNSPDAMTVDDIDRRARDATISRKTRILEDAPRISEEKIATATANTYISRANRNKHDPHEHHADDSHTRASVSFRDSIRSCEFPQGSVAITEGPSELRFFGSTPGGTTGLAAGHTYTPRANI